MPKHTTLARRVAARVKFLHKRHDEMRGIPILDEYGKPEMWQLKMFQLQPLAVEHSPQFKEYEVNIEREGPPKEVHYRQEALF